MTFDETMAALRKAGSPAIAKIYARHGAGENCFGVRFADLYALQKKIKSDQPLAEKLWASGNHDARTLALLVADPATVTAATLDRWLDEAGERAGGLVFSQLTARAPAGRSRMERWMASPEEGRRDVGYSTLAMLFREKAAPPDADCARYLATIEKEIHGSPNFARLAMVNALIAIGIGKPALRADAIAAARRIGKVEVDHGDTGCKTPEPIAYIMKAVGRAKKKASKVKK